MALPNHHIILRQVFELEFPAGADGFALQQEITRIVWEKLLPQMETLFDRVAGPDELIRIDKLDLDIGHVPPEELEAALLRTVMKQMEEQLDIAIINRRAGTERLPVADSYLKHWLFFLEKGHLPHQAASVPEPVLQTLVLEKLATETIAVERFSRLLRNSAAARLRLVRQHAEPFLVHLLETLTAASQQSLSDYRRETLRWLESARTSGIRLTFKQIPAASPAQFSEFFWLSVFDLALGPTAFPPTTENLYAEWLRRLIASVGPDQARLSLFWQEVARLETTPFPLLKKMLGLYPVLLKSAEQTSQYGVSGAGISSEPGEDSKTPPAGKELQPSGKQPAGETGDAGAEDQAGQGTTQNPAQTGSDKSPRIPDVTISESPSVVEPERSAPAVAGQEDSPATTGELQQAGAPPEARKPDRASPPQTSAEFAVDARTGDFWYVRNAGVVLLHPFLPPFFKTLGLVDAHDFVDEAARHKAVHLLHFLATGQTEAPEYELVLPRFLCGVPFEIPLERFPDITAAEQAEGEKLLMAAINHWNKLGNTSPGGLREGFLQRDGKLEKREAGWYLGVEQKTIDILLDFLPWNLSIIKLPWLPELLRVEWA